MLTALYSVFQQHFCIYICKDILGVQTIHRIGHRCSTDRFAVSPASSPCRQVQLKQEPPSSDAPPDVRFLRHKWCRWCHKRQPNTVPGPGSEHCNSEFADQKPTYPWQNILPNRAAKKSCPSWLLFGKGVPTKRKDPHRY